MMDIRNVTRLADGRFDCEINHPAFGWLPFTASVTDPEQMGRDVFAAAAATNPPAYVAPEVDEAAVLAAERASMRVSSLQAKAALHGAGLLAGVQTYMATAGFLTQLAWAEATEFRRASALVAEIAGKFGLTDSAVDDLFRAAALIEF